MERAFRDVLPTKADGNNVFSGLRGCVVDVKGAVVILHHVHIQLHPLWCLHLAGHLALPSSLGIHRDDRVL